MATEATPISVYDPIPAKLRDIAAKVKSGEKPEPRTVRDLLSFFGAQKRGYWIVNQIRTALRHLDIATVPDFENVWIDANVEFVPATVGSASPSPTAEIAVEGPAEAEPLPESKIGGEGSKLITGGSGDPTYRIGKLYAANQGIRSVKLDDQVLSATTLMLRDDFSQLAVMHSDRDVKGIISWRSLGARMALGLPCERVRDCREEARVVSSDSSLFATIPTIVEHGYVLIKAADNRISGIVTASDLSLQFRQLAEPFLVLGEIERHIRRLIEGKFTAGELEAVRDPADGQRPVERVADLTLGEYIRLIENPERWHKLALKIDRAYFVAELHKIRIIRNDVMHFDPDPLGDSDLQLLRSFVRFLQKLQEMLPVDHSP